jgi:hypothetical protein
VVSVNGGAFLRVDIVKGTTRVDPDVVAVMSNRLLVLLLLRDRFQAARESFWLG